MPEVESVSAQSGPLSGVRVLDLTRVLAGPYCTMVLLDLGASVIKVENPSGGDDARGFGPFIGERSAYFMSLNRGKRSIALDLKQEADRAVFERLLSHTDVLVENFRPGTMEKLGYGWEALHSRFPRLIYAAASGFGHTGPYADRPAYDMVVQGMGGIMSLTGYPGGPPTRVGSSIGDITAGLFTAIGAASALYSRNTTGQGVKIDVSMLDCQLAILENAIVRYFTTGQIPGPLGARHPSITPFEAYAAQDGHVIIAAGNDKLFHLALEVLDLPELAADPRFISGPERNRNADSLKRHFEAALERHDVAYWLDKLQARGVPSGPINNVAQILADPQIKSRNMVVTALDKVAGELHMAGNPIKMSAFSDPSTRGAPPELDGDREEIIRELNDSVLRISRLKHGDRETAARFIQGRYGATQLPADGSDHDVCNMPCFVGEIDSEIAGLAGFVIEGKECRLIALDAARPGRGHGGALLQAVIAHARAEGCTRLLAWAGNHNLRGLAFLQKRGFGIAALLPGRLTAWRAANPGAIAPGDPAIAARDLLELSLSL